MARPDGNEELGMKAAVVWKLMCSAAGLAIALCARADVDCVKGDRACGADDHVYECQRKGDATAWSYTSVPCKGHRWSDDMGIPVSACSPGATKCGADDHVLRCSSDGRSWVWSSENCR